MSGTAAVRDAVHSLAAGSAGADTLSHLDRWAQGLPGRGACGLLDAAAGTAGSLLRTFPDLVRSHLGRPCPGCAAARPEGGPGRLAVAVPDVAGTPPSRTRTPLPV